MRNGTRGGAATHGALVGLATWLAGNGCVLDTTGDVPSTGGAGAGGADTSTATATSATTTAAAGGSAGEGGAGGSTTIACADASSCPEAPPCYLASCAEGQCSYAAVAEGTSCGVDLACDAFGACRAVEGVACNADVECASGACADGVCCDSACEGSCVACDRPGFEGQCSPHSPATDPEGTCLPGQCDGSGTCARGTALDSGAIASVSGETRARAIAADAAGGALVGGTFTATTSAGTFQQSSGGGYDAFLAKLDAAGNPVWLSRFGAGSDQTLLDVATGPNGTIAIVGAAGGNFDFGCGGLSMSGTDAFVVRFDANGTCLNAARFGDGPTQEATAVAFAPDGDLVFAGHFEGNIAPGPMPMGAMGARDVFVVRYQHEANGAWSHVWSQRFGGNGTDTLADLAVDAAGDVVIAGHVDAAASFGALPLPYVSYLDGFVVKLDGTSGTPLWAQGIRAFGAQRALGVATSPAGLVAVTGSVDNTDVDFGGGPVSSPTQTTDAFLAMYSPMGQLSYARRFVGVGFEEGRSVAFDAAGSVVVTGELDNSIDFGAGALTGPSDVFAAKFAQVSPTTWAPLWTKRFGDPSEQRAAGVAIGPTGNVWIAGTFLGTVDFTNGVPLASGGSFDAYWARLAP